MVFCLDCGTMAMKELRHRTKSTSKQPPEVILDGIEVTPHSGNSRGVQVKFRYGEDTVDDEGTRILAPHNSTFLNDKELSDFEAMSEAERKSFLLDLGRREWEALEEMEAIKPDLEDMRLQLDGLAGNWLGEDLLKLASPVLN